MTQQVGLSNLSINFGTTPQKVCSGICEQFWVIFVNGGGICEIGRFIRITEMSEMSLVHINHCYLDTEW